MFCSKSVAVAEVQPIAETHIVTTNVNVVDVNVTTRSKVIEEYVFKDENQEKQIMLLARKRRMIE